MRSWASSIKLEQVRLCLCSARARQSPFARGPPPRRRPATSLAARTPSPSRRGLPASRTAGSTPRRRRLRAFPNPRRRSPIRFGPQSASFPRHDRDHRSRPEGHEERPRPAGVAGTSTRARAFPTPPAPRPTPRARPRAASARSRPGARAKKNPIAHPEPSARDDETIDDADEDSTPSPFDPQDGPPPGGYPSVRYARRVPSTGPTGAAFFGAYLGAMVYGFYQIGQGNARRRASRRRSSRRGRCSCRSCRRRRTGGTSTRPKRERRRRIRSWPGRAGGRAGTRAWCTTPHGCPVRHQRAQDHLRAKRNGGIVLLGPRSLVS